MANNFLNMKSNSVPTQYELTQIAATLLLDRDRDSCGLNEIVSSALRLWHRAGIALDKEERNISEQEIQAICFVGGYKSSLSIGKHKLPYISDDFLRFGETSLDDFLIAVVGLTDAGDRMKWFRGYIKSEQHRFYNFMPTKEAFDALFEDFPGLVTSDTRTGNYSVENSQSDNKSGLFIQFFRENGFNHYPFADKKAPVAINNSTCFHVENYRKWRLTMKTPLTKRTEPYELADCLEKGKAKKIKKTL